MAGALFSLSLPSCITNKYESLPQIFGRETLESLFFLNEVGRREELLPPQSGAIFQVEEIAGLIRERRVAAFTTRKNMRKWLLRPQSTADDLSSLSLPLARSLDSAPSPLSQAGERVIGGASTGKRTFLYVAIDFETRFGAKFSEEARRKGEGGQAVKNNDCGIVKGAGRTLPRHFENTTASPL